MTHAPAKVRPRRGDAAGLDDRSGRDQEPVSVRLVRRRGLERASEVLVRWASSPRESDEGLRVAAFPALEGVGANGGRDAHQVQEGQWVVRP